MEGSVDTVYTLISRLLILESWKFHHKDARASILFPKVGKDIGALARYFTVNLY